jgi:hypothetical protein
MYKVAISAAALAVALGSCAGRDPQPMAAVQPQATGCWCRSLDAPYCAPTPQICSSRFPGAICAAGIQCLADARTNNHVSGRGSTAVATP